ncbi:MAG: DUF3014 domain-containing protein [Syntrophotaleaceae bacterium]
MILFWPGKSSQPPSVSDLGQPPADFLSAAPEIRYPLPEAPAPSAEAGQQDLPPLPALGESDPFIGDLLRQLFNEPAQQELLSSQHFIQRLVLIIDALPNKNLPIRHLPLRGPPGSFQTAGETGAKVIATANFSRYAPFVGLAEAVPPQRLAEAYLRVYPLLEQAYRELGYPRGYFHDRMITVLDHLLATPQVTGPIPLIEHVTCYGYADPKLEALSAGQTLLRMGPENARRVKEVLQQLRDLLAGRQAES